MSGRRAKQIHREVLAAMPGAKKGAVRQAYQRAKKDYTLRGAGGGRLTDTK